MKLASILFLAGGAVAGGILLDETVADHRRERSPAMEDRRSPEFGPFESPGERFAPGCCDFGGRGFGRRSPRSFGSFGSHRRFGSPVQRNRPPDGSYVTRRLALQLEFAARLFHEEVRFGLPDSAESERLVAETARLIKSTQHLWAAVDKEANHAHLQTDIQAVAESIEELDRVFGDFGGDVLASRSLADMSRTLLALRAQVRNSAVPPVGQVPVPGRGAPAEPKDARPVGAPIPEGMQGIALLPAADREAALAQRTCPVTGELLGAHGKPLKVQVNGRAIFVCCRGCVAQLKSNPEKYLDE